MRTVRQKVCFAVFLASLAVMLTGCAGTWVTEAQGIIAMLVPAITGILGLLGAFGGGIIPAPLLDKITTVGKQVQADLKVVGDLLSQYTNADPTTQKSLLQKIDSALKTIIANWATVLPSLNITDPAVQIKVEAVVGAVVAELESLMALIPALRAAADRGDKDVTRVLQAVRAAGHELPLNAGQFKHVFNNAMKAKTGDKNVDSIAQKYVIQ